MKRNQVSGVVIDAIFAKTSEFDDIEDIKEDSNLSSDMAMDSLDLVELIMDIENGIMKWYSGEDDVMPIEINDNILDTIYFKRDKGRDVYRGYGISIEIFDDGYYLSLRDLEDDLSDPIQIKNLHHLQNLLMDLYGHDINIDKLYGHTGE